MLPILSAIPDPIKQQIADSLLEFLAKQAEKVAGDQVAGTLRKWTSRNDFTESVDKALVKGTQRFAEEYRFKDEDLAAALSADQAFWNSPKVREALTLLIQRPGAWLVDEQQLLAGHFEDVLPERVNRERVDRAVTFFLRCVVEELWTLPGAKEIRDVYILQFEKISAEAAREQVALAMRQIEATEQLSADVRQALAQLTESMEKHLLAAPALAALPSPKPYHNLPRPDYSRFVGRQEELAWLRQRLSPQDRAWQIAITGIGGVGKSALALAIAHEYREKYDQLEPEERFDAIIWISAKEEVLTAQGREKASLPDQVLRTLEDIYTAISHALDREDITRARPEEQGRVVEKALKEQRTLLIMDNLESVKDERIKPFLRNLPAPTKAVITSREWLDIAAVLSLRGLSPENADTFIQEFSQDRAVSLSLQQSVRLYDLTSGLPLPLKLSVARMAGGESFSSVERWLGDAESDLPEYCISGQIELARKRNPNTWNMLLACSLFERVCGASKDALGYVVDLSIADRDMCLAELQRLFLVNQTEDGRFWALPIVQRYASVQFTVESVNFLVDRWVEWLLCFVRAQGGDLRLKIERVHDFGIEYPNVLSCIRWCQKQKHWAELYELANHTWHYSYLVGDLQVLDEISKAAYEAAEELGDALKLAWVHWYFARIARWRGQFDQVLVLTNQAETIARQYKDVLLLGELWELQSYVFSRQGNLEEAKKLAQAIFELGLQNNIPSLSHYGAERLGAILGQLGEFDEAKRWLDQARTYAEQQQSIRFLASINSTYAVVLMEQGCYADAEAILVKNVQFYENWGDRRRSADCKRRLVEIYKAIGMLDLAYQMAVEAQETYRRLGMVQLVDVIQKIITQ